MSLTLKNEEAHRLARELAALTGESMATAVTEAVRERLDRLRRERGYPCPSACCPSARIAPAV
ncbi:hypothetical protein CKO38_15025 [Rhodospirillum rubrum]|uniref:type II toxin-antitoxin system VapB family antitoxin n=1 Tax=Rhodospirillum rubrum TaxID=1085 RepID=UPI001908DFFF|nr:type II toxin-antitoxin system VapB family antitoxin [Rhodospirillum rubrum]MBK1665855.1 hypothetical protein [Rhodospirillum rubrum]MBK1677958.1 hypothetical protein [Rhodospirillum rubrum]